MGNEELSNSCSVEWLLLVCHSRLMFPNCLEASTSLNNVETAYAHICNICHAREPESHHHDEIAEEEDGSLEVIALPLAVHVAEKEDAQNYSNHIPLGEDEAKGMVDELVVIKPLPINGTEQHQSWNLK